MESPNRESWLRVAYERLRADLLAEAPPVAAVAWSFPSKGATSRARRTIGQCWDGGGVRSVEGGHAVLVSPLIEEPVEVLSTLLHEMIHAAVGTDKGHRKEFSRVAKRLGFMKPWTQTPMGEELRSRLSSILCNLPPWPSGHLVPAPPKQKGRQQKAVCGCGRILRVARATFEGGPILCGKCGKAFDLEESPRVNAGGGDA